MLICYLCGADEGARDTLIQIKQDFNVNFYGCKS